MAKLWNWDSKEKTFISDDGDYLTFDEFIMYVNGLERMAKGALEAWDKATDGQRLYHRMNIWQREYRNFWGGINAGLVWRLWRSLTGREIATHRVATEIAALFDKSETLQFIAKEARGLAELLEEKAKEDTE